MYNSHIAIYDNIYIHKCITTATATAITCINMVLPSELTDTNLMTSQMLTYFDYIIYVIKI